MRNVCRSAVAVACAALVVATAAAGPAGADTGSAAGARPGYSLDRVSLADARSLVLRWNPCQIVTYRVNVRAVPASQRATVLAEIRGGVTRLAAATHLTYSYRGATAEVPRTSSIDRQSAELIVAVTTRATTDVGIGGTVLGYGGYHYWSWRVRNSAGQTSAGQARAGQASAGAAISRAWVVLDRAGLLALTPGFGPGAHRGNVILHELAHTVGLGHVTDDRQLMYPTLSAGSPNGYAAGDRAGLARLGRAAGCITVPAGTFKNLE